MASKSYRARHILTTCSWVLGILILQQCPLSRILLSAWTVS